MNESEKNIKTTVIQAEEDTSTKFEAHPSGVIFEIKANGKIAYISSGLEYITGFKSSEVLNISLNLFLEKFLGKQAVKQLLPLVNEVVIGKRKYLESNVKAIHPVTEEEKLYSLQIESSSNDLKRTVLFIHAHNQESQQSERLEEAQLRSMRILEKGNLIFLRSNDRLQITEILGDTEKILGIPSAELEDNPTGWLDVLLPEHYRSMNLALARVLKQPRRFTKELCFQHRKTKAHRWLLFSAVPVFEGSSVGSWEGFALDITERKSMMRV